MPSFFQGPSGNWTGVSGACVVLAVLLWSWQVKRVAMVDCTCKSILSHQYRSLSLCLVLTIPRWHSRARVTNLERKLSDTINLCVPLNTYESWINSSSLTRNSEITSFGSVLAVAGQPFSTYLQSLASSGQDEHSVSGTADSKVLTAATVSGSESTSGLV